MANIEAIHVNLFSVYIDNTALIFLVVTKLRDDTPALNPNDTRLK